MEQRQGLRHRLHQCRGLCFKKVAPKSGVNQMALTEGFEGDYEGSQDGPFPWIDMDHEKLEVILSKEV